MTLPLPDRLVTARLLLRPPVREDAVALFEQYTQREDVARFMTWRPQHSLAETEAFLERCLERWAGGEENTYIVERLDEPGRAIGNLASRLHGSNRLDLGYVLAPTQWGQGLMPEAIVGLVDTAFDAGWCWRAQASCDVENRASARTLEKAGFTREGLMRKHTLHPNLSPVPRDCYLYARVR